MSDIPVEKLPYGTPETDVLMLTLEAETSAGKKYRYEKTAKSIFDDNQYYEVTVQMTEVP